MMTKKSLEKRLDDLEKKRSSEDIRIFICKRSDGYIDIPQPDGTFRTITEKQFIAEGGIVVRSSDK